MSLLILVRHSQPEIVPDLPSHKWHLSRKGRIRCRSLAKILIPYHPQRIFTSKEPKAVETAQILAERLCLTLGIHPGLHEHERRTSPFISQDEFETSIAKFFSSPEELVFGEEAANQAQRRFRLSINSLLDRYPESNLVVIAHGTVITLFIAEACGVEPNPFWHRLGLPSFIVLSIPDLGVISLVESIQ